MITRKSQTIGGLVLEIRNRPQGSMEKQGKLIEWNAITQLIVLPFESNGDIRKYAIKAECVQAIEQTLANAHWASLIEIELEGKQVVSVEVVEDILKNFYENN